MPQSLSSVAVHLVFSTKNRMRCLVPAEFRRRLDAYIVGILKSSGCVPISTCVVIDHVHMLFLLSRTESVSDVVQIVKGGSSRWIKNHVPDGTDPFLMKFHWQKGYGAFSVSQSMIQKVKEYILHQEEHHKRVSFQEEYRGLLARHNIAYDERYVWD